MTADRDSAVVKTTVSPEMKAEWQNHADALDMTQSEFVEAMVQAGRRKITPRPGPSDQTVSEDATPGVDGLETHILGALDENTFVSWDGLVDGVIEDIESEIDTVVTDLQKAGQVKYSGRLGGYSLATD